MAGWDVTMASPFGLGPAYGRCPERAVNKRQEDGGMGTHRIFPAAAPFVGPKMLCRTLQAKGAETLNAIQRKRHQAMTLQSSRRDFTPLPVIRNCLL